MTRKKVIAVVVTTLALTVGSIGVAGAASKASHKVSVTKAHADRDRSMGGKGGPHGADRAATQALISATIGVDSATIKSRLQAGESLALIAGAKKDALIAVLVTDHTKRIDAAVAAGTITAAQAGVMKSKVVEHVTTKVNAVGGKHGFGKGGHGRGHGGHGSKGGMKAPTLPTPTATTGA